MTLLSPLLTLVAQAGTYSVTAHADYAAPAPDLLTLNLSCPRGTELVGGGAGMDLWLPIYQASALSGEATRYHAAWHRVSGTPAPEANALEASAVCADDPCLERVEATTALDGTDSKSLTVHCPSGTFAIGGGFSVTGKTASGIEVHRSSAVGLLAPTGWRVDARELTAVRTWGLKAEVRCVAPSVLSEVTMMTRNANGGAGVFNGPYYGYTWPWVGHSLDAAFVIDSGWLLSLGARAIDLGGLLGLGPSDDADPARSWTADITTFASPGTVGTRGEIAMYAADPVTFGEAIEACNPMAGEPPAPPYFELGAEVMFGLAGGGNGVVFLPGEGPVPVDPEPFREAFDALPAVVVGYSDPLELDARLAEIEDGLDATQTPWIALDDPAGTLPSPFANTPFGGAPGVVLVVPQDEAAAVAWMSANRDAVAGLAHVTVLALELDGPGFDALAAW